MSRIRDKLARLHRANPTERPDAPVHEVRRAPADIEAAIRAADPTAGAAPQPPDAPQPPEPSPAPASTAPAPTPPAPQRAHASPTRASTPSAPRSVAPTPSAPPSAAPRPKRREMPHTVRIGDSDVNPSSFRRWKMRRLADDAPEPAPAAEPAVEPAPAPRQTPPPRPVAAAAAGTGPAHLPGAPALAAWSALPGPITAHFACDEHASDAGRCLIARASIALEHVPGCPPAGDPHVYLDLETTGLRAAAGDLAFVVGLAHVVDDRLVLEQALADDEPSERAAVAWARERLCGAAVVSYNGASFDIPFLRARLRAHGLAELQELEHIDLLKLARRGLPALPDHRLATVEAAVLGFVRHGDVPGSEAPARHARWRATGDAASVAPIVAHNRLDLAVMLALRSALVDAG